MPHFTYFQDFLCMLFCPVKVPSIGFAFYLNLARLAVILIHSLIDYVNLIKIFALNEPKIIFLEYTLFWIFLHIFEIQINVRVQFIDFSVFSVLYGLIPSCTFIISYI